ncbi:3-methyladenine DNA glycosylase [Limihaloglobus sulfuriphilus]|uniref:3-methyladenine DNA glycosylase n=1 Tax=Limihaloglobus sulfuriphilus TaxID=1851148 RepID=A0A1Q2MAL0_9BACT|nr:endonuclease III domain-containing protein [Limihaloglobus sulfuriphilus]AQQ69700.1 3-methyladenine DNA glycosylase [Limihaloglobus sulfuriphilus]
MSSSETIRNIYLSLHAAYGNRDWWPAVDGFEVIVGAILTQNTNWKNVEKAIKNLKTADVMTPIKLHELPREQLAELIRPAGYYNIKAARLKNLLDWMVENYSAGMESISALPDWQLREELLAVKGVGPETADSIMLYAFNRPIFVVDAYTARVFGRHMLIDEYADYHQIQELVQSSIEPDLKIYNEFHALIVEVGKNHCKPRPKCQGCPLEHLPHQVEEV